MRFLVEASGLLNASLDVSPTLARVARLAVPRMADCCVLHFVTPSGLDPVVVEHRDPEEGERLRSLLREYPIADADALGVANVARTGQPELYAEFPDDLLSAVVRDQAHLDRVRSLGVRSAMLVPLTARGQTFGVLSLAVTDSGRRFDDDDLAMALSLGRRAALAVDNARLYSEMADAAHRGP
jgi:GAF domain-containing protein